MHRSFKYYFLIRRLLSNLLSEFIKNLKFDNLACSFLATKEQRTSLKGERAMITTGPHNSKLMIWISNE